MLRPSTRSSRSGIAVLRRVLQILMFTFFVSAMASAGEECLAVPNAMGEVDLPPKGCSYLSPDEVHMIVDGLPPGTTINIAPIHLGFFCRAPAGNAACTVEPGGNLGGEREVFDSTLVLDMTGTGELAGFERLISLPLQVETHIAPPGPGAGTFDTDMFLLQGNLFGDPDFAQLQIIGGTNFKLPSPGQTTLTPRSDGTIHVDSFFDITYQISFVGSPGGALEGLSGTTENTVRVEAEGLRDPCRVADDGSGTVVLPPPGCDYLSANEVHMIIDGLPAGTTIELSPRHTAFACVNAGCGTPGGNLGGEVEAFDSIVVLELRGTGELADFRRILRLPAAVETHTAPRTPGDPVQSFLTEMHQLQGSLTGDPDFESLRITAGAGLNLPPSPGHTTLERQPEGDFIADSFFDITYEIAFEGAPGGALEGLGGTTRGTTRVEARRGQGDAVERDNGSGTVTLPPRDSQYLTPNEVHRIIDGLPPGTTIELDASHLRFFCVNDPCGQPGGRLGGESEVFDSMVNLRLTGTGQLAGLQRDIEVPLMVETHTAPRTPGSGPQSFNTDMFRLQGALLGDPDFGELIITGGTENGLPGPGHTLLTPLPDGNFNVDSFFDISYQIDFVGATGGILEGISGSTVGATRVRAAPDPNGFTIFLGDFELGDSSEWTVTVPAPTP